MRFGEIRRLQGLQTWFIQGLIANLHELLGGLGHGPAQPQGGLGRGGVHVDPAALHHGAVEPVPGGGGLRHVAHTDEPEALGTLLVKDDLGVDDAAVTPEEALEVGGAEPEGQVGDVEAAGELLGRLPGAELLAQVVAGEGGALLGGVRWSGGQVVRWSGGQVVRWSGVLS